MQFRIVLFWLSIKTEGQIDSKCDMGHLYFYLVFLLTLYCSVGIFVQIIMALTSISFMMRPGFSSVVIYSHP